MVVGIVENTVKETLYCVTDFACRKYGFIEVEDHIPEKVRLVTFCANENCRCRMSVDGFFICNCPARKEIYNKHGV